MDGSARRARPNKNLFPRLLKPDAVKEANARGVREGSLAYVGKAVNARYDPFEFKTNLLASRGAMKLEYRFRSWD